jgi:hypothetical protein
LKNNNNFVFQLEVKKTPKGGITITTMTRGNVVLTTRKKEAAAAAASSRKAAPPSPGYAPAPRATQIGSLTRRVGRSGAISLNTRKAVTAISRPLPSLRPSAPRPPPLMSARPSAVSARSRSSVGGRSAAASVRQREEPIHPLTRTIRGEMSAAAQLDGRL